MAVFRPALGGAVAGGGSDVGDGEGGTIAHQAAGCARSAELREAIAGVPASYLAPMIGRYLGQIDPQASASVRRITVLPCRRRLQHTLLPRLCFEKAYVTMVLLVHSEVACHG